MSAQIVSQSEMLLNYLPAKQYEIYARHMNLGAEQRLPRSLAMAFAVGLYIRFGRKGDHKSHVLAHLLFVKIC